MGQIHCRFSKSRDFRLGAGRLRIYANEQGYNRAQLTAGKQSLCQAVFLSCAIGALSLWGVFRSGPYV